MNVMSTAVQDPSTGQPIFGDASMSCSTSTERRSHACLAGLTEDEARLHLVPSNTTLFGFAQAGHLRRTRVVRPGHQRVFPTDIALPDTPPVPSRSPMPTPSPPCNRHTGTVANSHAALWPRSHSRPSPPDAARARCGRSSSRSWANSRNTPATPTSCASKYSRDAPTDDQITSVRTATAGPPPLRSRGGGSAGSRATAGCRRGWRSVRSSLRSGAGDEVFEFGDAGLKHLDGHDGPRSVEGAKLVHDV